MKRNSRFFTLLLPGLVALALLGSSCTEQRSKEKDGVNNPDYLFLDIFFGMGRKEFFDYCWDMNKQQKLVHGTGNTSVQYRLEKELPQPVIMQFYPSFYEDKIYEMPVTFSYEGWAPWNKEFWSDKLLEDMVPVFEKWYGKGFKVLNHPVQGKVYAKIDKHRRINLFIRDDQYVQAVFTDLKTEKKKEKAEAEKAAQEGASGEE